MEQTKSKALFRGYHFPMEIYLDNQRNGGFTQLSLDLGSSCNYSCDWCFNKHLLNKSEPDKLNLNEKIDLVKQASRLGAKTLVIPGTGEPTLDRDFYPLIQEARKSRLTTVVYTNLTGKVDEEKIELMHDNDVSIGIKLDSFDLAYFERRYHTSTETFDKFLANLEKVKELYKNSKKVEEQGTVHRLIANMVLTRENKGELERIAEFCQKSDIPLFVRPVKPVLWAQATPDKWQEIGNTSGDLNPEIELINLASKYNTLFSPSCTPENHCAIYSFGLTVKNNGDVQVCPDHHESRGSFGNIRKETLGSIMEKLNRKRVVRSGFCVMLPRVEHELK